MERQEKLEWLLKGEFSRTWWWAGNREKSPRMYYRHVIVALEGVEVPFTEIGLTEGKAKQVLVLLDLRWFWMTKSASHPVSNDLAESVGPEDRKGWDWNVGATSPLMVANGNTRCWPWSIPALRLDVSEATRQIRQHCLEKSRAGEPPWQYVSRWNMRLLTKTAGH